MTLLFPATRRACGVLALAVTVGTAGSAGAQNSQPPATIPGLDSFSLPTQPVRPTPVPTPEPRVAPLPRPTPSATATSSATPVPATVTPPPVRPTVRAMPTPRANPTATPTPIARPTVPASAVTPTPAPAAIPTSAPAPQASPSAVAVAAAPASGPTTSKGWGSLGLWAAGVSLIAVCAGAALYWRRRRNDETGAEAAPVTPPSPVPSPLPPAPVAEAPAAPRPRVEIALEVKRAGTNLLSAAIEYRVVLHNAGAVDARAIALDLRLFGIEPALERTLDALFAAPIERAVVARFDLAAGATAALEGTAMLPRDVMPPLALQGIGEGRVLFVPVMTVALDYAWEGGRGRSAASFVVGLDRGADAKLGPFRLDGPPRMHDRVRHLPFTVSRDD